MLCVFFKGRRRCAVGWLIPNELKNRVRTNFNQEGVEELLRDVPELLQVWNVKTASDRIFLSRMQNMLHDGYDTGLSGEWGSWVKTRATLFAKNFKLSTKFLSCK